MTLPGDRGQSWQQEQGLARFRGALMAVLPPDHPVHDRTREFTEAELEQFEAEFMERFE